MKTLFTGLICLVAGFGLAVLVLPHLSNDSGKNGEIEGGAAGIVSRSAPGPGGAPYEPAATERRATTTLLPGGGEPETPSATKETALKELMGKVFSGEASEDEQLRFWEEARSSDALGGIMKELEESVAGDSEDVSSRMNLAQAYVTKLLGVPMGPEKGLWSAKAERMWREVLEIDSNHWEAQKSVAFALSQYPDFLNKAPVAIREYEKLIEIQGLEQTEPNGSFAGSYLELSRLHHKNGNPASAVEVLEAGLERHPDHGGIAGQLKTLRSSYVFETDPAPEEP